MAKLNHNKALQHKRALSCTELALGFVLMHFKENMVIYVNGVKSNV